MGLLYYLRKKTQVKTSIGFVSSGYSFLSACLLGAGIFLFTSGSTFGQKTLLDKPISIPRQHTTLYSALNLISQKADCLFIYDSQIIDNNKKVRLSANNLSLKKLLDNLLLNPELSYKEIGKHILIYKSAPSNPVQTQIKSLSSEKDSSENIIIRGHIYDNENKSALSFASVTIPQESIGTITNADGYFVLKVPSAFIKASLVVSHVGYTSQQIPVQLLNAQKVDFFLERRIISIQEVIIRYFDPEAIVEKAMQQRETNNSREPVYLTSFYREGVQKNNRLNSYSEAVFKVYKSSYAVSEYSDQVKLLKSRKIQNTSAKDTVFLKLKAGVLSALQLDIVKCVPGFLENTDPKLYNYTYSDIVSYNERNAYAVTFVQKDLIEDALYKGTLYIEEENHAILGAEFEINPAFLEKAAEELILKKSPRLKVKLEKISYSVSYMPFNGKYYLSHARCDIQLKTRQRNHFSFDNFNTFLELATCHIDTTRVVKFDRTEVMKPNVVFSDAPFSNDNSFWGDYNTIAPEEKLSEALNRISGKIEEIENE